MNRHRLLPPLLSAGVAIALAAVALAGLWAAPGAYRAVALAGSAPGVPIEVFAPPSDSLRAGLVVAHGFSGNRQLMYGFGFALAQSGYTVALVDFAGHGASPDRLPPEFDEARYQKLAANLDAAIEHLRAQWGIPSERIAILGHSMGASAVTRYAVEHPDIPATIAISLGEFGGRLPAQADRPRNLLVMVGAAEFAGFLNGSAAALRAAYPDGAAGPTYGDFASGTARRLVLVPGVEHITILFSNIVYRESAAWLGAAFNVPARVDAAADQRMGWVLALYLAAAIGFYPLARLLLAGRRPPESAGAPRPIPARVALLLVLAAALSAPLLMTVIPYRWMPLTVGNYAGVFFLVVGVIVWLGSVLYARLTRRPRQPAGPPASRPARDALAALALTAYALLTFGLTAHLTWTNFALPGERGWMAVALFVFLLIYFLADERLIQRPSGRARLALYALSRLALIVGLVIGVFAFGGPFFLLILLPVMLVLFIWHGVYGFWLHRLGAPAWIAAALNAALFAWLIAATFPVVS